MEKPLLGISDRERFRIVNTLKVRDISDAAWQLTNLLGFKAERAYLDVRTIPKNCQNLRMRRLNQVIELVKSDSTAKLGKGPIDHLALNAYDIDAVYMGIKAKWGKIDELVSPDGPIRISQFWDQGVDFFFMDGPEGASIEFASRVNGGNAEQQKRMVNIGGHDHIGLRVRNIKEASDFFEALGFRTVSQIVLPFETGEIEIEFKQRGEYLLELSTTPESRDPRHSYSANPAWASLIFEDNELHEDQPNLVGPSGIVIEFKKRVHEPEFTFNKGDLVDA